MTSSSLLLVTSNGTGMGHLARQLAIALAAEGRATLFSMSAALPTVVGQGIDGEYCPGPDRDWIPERVWAQYLAARIQLIAEEVNAGVVVFDGVAPYRGVTLARSRMSDIPFVWFRRGMWQKGINEGQLWKAGLFDSIIEPGDLASAADVGPTATRNDALRVPPVSLVDVVEPLSRPRAASALGLDPDSKHVLMTLGTGRLGDVSGPGSVIMDALAKRTDWQIGVATSSIAQNEIPVADPDRVAPIRGVFPLVRYLTAFDAAVSAAGYNSVHELIPAGVPTLLVPNTATRTDDQSARAHEIARRGLALSADPDSPDDLRRAVDRLLDQSTRQKVAEAIAATPDHEKGGGAARIAVELIGLAHEFVPKRSTGSQVLLQARASAREAVKGILGPEGTNRVRRLLGRAPIDTSEMLDVSLGATLAGVRQLRFLEEPSTQALLGNDPVEHVLPGSSEGYRAARDQLAFRYYNVVNR